MAFMYLGPEAHFRDPLFHIFIEQSFELNLLLISNLYLCILKAQIETITVAEKNDKHSSFRTMCLRWWWEPLILL